MPNPPSLCASFANSIVAANYQSLHDFRQPLANIFVIHSRKSQAGLHADNDWLDHLERNNVKMTNVIERVIDMPDLAQFDEIADAAERQAHKAAAHAQAMKQFVADFVAYLEFILKGNDGNQRLMVDLTNSTTQYKNLLSPARISTATSAKSAPTPASSRITYATRSS